MKYVSNKKTTFYIFFALVMTISVSCMYNVHSVAQADSTTVTTQMNDTKSSYGLSAYSNRPIQAEYVSTTSSLVGKSIDTITVYLKKVGTPTGDVTIGIFNSDLSVKQLVGSIDASTVSRSYTSYTFSLPSSQSYKIQSGDRIGIMFAGGSSSNFVAIMTDQSDTFDGTKSYLNYYYNKIWRVFTSSDLTMTLKLNQYDPSTIVIPVSTIVSPPTVSVSPPPTVSASPAAGTYNSAQSITLTASAPSTIYYTTDGSTPTTSSTNGTSPISGITINTSTTLKFFAKDSLGSVSPIVTQVYTITLPPTVSASPAAGTYNSAQSITLTASSPSTIYYTTDGSTPTTSSTNGASPVSSISINTSTTLKFFAKDSLGSVSPIVTQGYTITLPPTVSASPSGGTYNSAQSITLTASTPSTIYYTTDGSTPTTSSTNGASPVSSISINTSTTLKFFAKDSLGSVSPIVTQGYTITLPPAVSVSSSADDTFGVMKLYPSITGGREWYANWSTPAHKIASGDYDPYDSQFQARGDGYVKVNGDGTALMSGSAPRMYVKDPTLKKQWNNVEITFYGKRVSDTLSSYQGLTAGARSGSHDDVTYPNVCTDSTGYPNTAYNARILYDGRVDYEKEVLYHRGDATSYGAGVYPTIKPAFENLSTPVYSSSGYHSMPYNTWIGYKFIIQSTSTGVHMETWMDMTNGTNGGTWIKMNSFNDNGGWSVYYWYSQYNSTNWPCPNMPLDYVINHAMPYVFVRADSVSEVDYKKFSIREINPLP